MTFLSVLFPNNIGQVPSDKVTTPAFLVDLNLDQVIAAITAGKEEYNLKPFFYTSLQNLDAINFRQEIMQDMEDAPLFDSIKSFAQSMHAMREHLAQAERLRHEFQKYRWFLDAVEIYCDGVVRLIRSLSTCAFKSRGLLALKEFLDRYMASEVFILLSRQTRELRAALSAIRYTVSIRDLQVQVGQYGGERNYSVEIEDIFQKFKQGAVKDYDFKFGDHPEMNHVEGEILTRVARLYPEVFQALENYCSANKHYQDETVVRFDREIEFYIAYLEYIALFKNAGLHFCYPQVVRECKEVYNYRGFDLALAGKLMRERGEVVCNDFHLSGRERVIVVSGPNQGGKTTFARTFGQLHYLASLGCPVPGTQAQTFLFDQLFTHFEKQEDITNLRGKLQDDLVRIHDILERATPNSIIIMNEIFTSTTLQDAIALSKKIATAIIALDLLCLWVTFVDELASFGERTVSMVSTVVPENPVLRTYKIIRRPADGVAYAMAIAEKYRLTYPMIKERIGA